MQSVSNRANKPISVTLGPLAGRVEQRLNSGQYSSASEVLRAGLRALDREDEAFDTILRAKVAEALSDTRPEISAEALERHLDERHARRLAGDA
ncbi:MAG: addiction module antidote protein [Alphaproteobacteria bacterium]|nr:addiction module antidote protein [Alphaproteobacteria bacterium]